MTKYCKQAVRNIVATISMNMVKIANGSASSNYSYQPKEPENLKRFLKKK